MRFLVFGIFWIASLSVHAQLDSILALPEEIQIKALWDKYSADWKMDSVKHVSMYRQLQEELTQRGKKELVKQAWLLEVYYRTVGLHRFDEAAIHEISQAIEEAERKGWDDIVAECLVFRGTILYDQNQYGPAFENMLRGYGQLKALGFEKNPFTLRHLSRIAEIYYRFGDYESSVKFTREALSVHYPWDDESFKRHLMNTLGLCFQRLDRYDSAKYYFKRSHEASLVVKDTSWAALALGNLGYVYYLNGEYESAIPMLKYDFSMSDRFGEYASAVNAALALAEIYLLQGNAEAAEEYISYSKGVNRNELRALSSYYKSQYIINKLRGDLTTAVTYVDSFLISREKLLRENDAKILAQAKLKVEVEQHAHEISTLKAKRDREVLLRNGALVFLLMVGMISILWFSRRSLKRKKEYELSLLQKKMAEDELANAQRELNAFTKMLKEKNELIESFKAEIESLQLDGMQQSDARTDHLNRLINATLLTDDDWREFRQLFDKVYPGFFIRLKEKMPDLNPADIRLLALTKLQLAPKEMAAMLGIGYEAIKKSRQRLRKKINLPEEGTLEEVVNMI